MTDITPSNIYLLTHRGGDSAHFIMWCLFRFCDGLGDQRWTDNPIHTDRNSFDGWESAVRHKDNREHFRIDTAISENRPWWEDSDFYSIRDYSLDNKYIQQIHSFPCVCSRVTVGDNILLSIAVASEDYQWRISKLDVIKQVGYFSEQDYAEFPEVSAHVAAQYSQHALFVPNDTVKIHYINYDELIGNASYDEFVLLANTLGLTVTATNEEVSSAIKEYNSNNDRVIESHESLSDSQKKEFVMKMNREIQRLQSKNSFISGIDNYRNLR